MMLPSTSRCCSGRFFIHKTLNRRIKRPRLSSAPVLPAICDGLQHSPNVRWLVDTAAASGGRHQTRSSTTGCGEHADSSSLSPDVTGMTEETQALAEALVLSSCQGSVVDSDVVSSLESPPIWQHRVALSKAITLVESRAPDKQKQASLLLTHLMRYSQSRGERADQYFRLGM